MVDFFTISVVFLQPAEGGYNLSTKYIILRVLYSHSIVMNSLEWSGGMERWSGLLDWSGRSRFSQSEKLRNYLSTRFCAIHAVSNQQSYNNIIHDCTIIKFYLLFEH